MTDEMMSLKGLLEKSPDAGLLREMIGFVAQRLMELEVGGLTRGRFRRAERRAADATATVTGTGRPAPARSSSRIPKLRKARTSTASWSCDGWPRRRSPR